MVKSNDEKLWFLVCGSECSGTKLIARIVSDAHKVRVITEWHGFGRVRRRNDDKVVVEHVSFPRQTLKDDVIDWLNIQEYVEMVKKEGYKLVVVIVLRDRSISVFSKMNTWGESMKDCYGHFKKFRTVFEELTSFNPVIISYEGLLFLKGSYLNYYKKELMTDKDFKEYDSYIFDANNKYVKNTI